MPEEELHDIVAAGLSIGGPAAKRTAVRLLWCEAELTALRARLAAVEAAAWWAEKIVLEHDANFPLEHYPDRDRHAINPWESRVRYADLRRLAAALAPPEAET